MCGKFTQYASWEEVHAFSQPLVATGNNEALVVATPMRVAKVMRLGAGGQRELVAMRWGFAGKDDASPVRPKHMHARSETIDTRPTFGYAVRHGRGILMVHTFNEGEELPNGKTRQWVITPRDGQPVAIAVICERWENGPEVLDTFIMVTTPPNALIARITDRMPGILPREAWPIWLGETEAPLAEVRAVLRTFDDGGNWTMTEQDAPKPSRAQRSAKQDGQGSLF
jgi:putative SOS response-associated peptidase YedK